MKKQIQQTTLSLGLLLGLASPSIATAWNLKAESAARNTLASQLKNPSSQSMQIKSPSADNILDAVKKVGGKATVQMGNGDSLKIDIQEKANGGSVIVGSGADELVATSNSSGGSSTVVISPPPMTTSITVVTPENKARYQSGFCLIEIPSNFENLIDDARSFNENIFSNVTFEKKSLGKFNQPFRTKPGTYILEIKRTNCKFNNFSPSSLSSFKLVTIKPGENTIIFLQQIQISKVDFALYGITTIWQQIESKEDKNLIKLLYSFTQYTHVLETLWISLLLCTDNTFVEKYNESNNFPYGNFKSYLNTVDIILKSQFSISNSSDAYDLVFPGKYSVAWEIENSCNVTKNISIE